ncbi:hypothetical protein [Agromyces laixinhei]|uniref:hypothetical protein n=1 Tax=Agromyces laixinhei TaxID=2585717 RepID=UPI0012EDCBFC|nr:hypothetical protein [Agromyces laixinhei]
MEFENEEELKKAMGIESWRNLSKDKFLTFVSELPNMSKEVAIKVVEQFPDFKTMVLDSLSHVQEQATNAVGTNWKSQKRVHKAFAEYREILGKELDREGLTAEGRLSILDLLQKAINDESLKDSEHKAFVLRALGMVATAAVVVVVAGVTVLGGKAKINV